MSESQGSEEFQSIWVAGQERIEVPAVLPVLPVRDVVIYPGVTVPLAIGRSRSLAALEAAGPEGFMIVATQRDPALESPALEDLPGPSPRRAVRPRTRRADRGPRRLEDLRGPNLRSPRLYTPAEKTCKPTSERFGVG